MTRRNYFKGSAGFTVGILGSGLVSTQGRAEGTTGNQCPATLSVPQSGTANYQRTRPWALYSIDGEAAGVYFTAPWSAWGMTSGAPPAVSTVASTLEHGQTPNKCTYSSPDVGTTNWAAEISPTNPDPGSLVPLETLPAGATVSTEVEAIEDGTPRTGTITQNGTKTWSRSVTYQSHGACQ